MAARVAAAVVLLLALGVALAAAPDARAKQRPIRAKIALPDPGNLTVADIALRAPGKKAPPLRRVKVMVVNAGKLPGSVTVIPGVAHEPGKRRRLVVRVVILNPAPAPGVARSLAGGATRQIRLEVRITRTSKASLRRLGVDIWPDAIGAGYGEGLPPPRAFRVGPATGELPEGHTKAEAFRSGSNLAFGRASESQAVGPTGLASAIGAPSAYGELRAFGADEVTFRIVTNAAANRAALVSAPRIVTAIGTTNTAVSVGEHTVVLTPDDGNFEPGEEIAGNVRFEAPTTPEIAARQVTLEVGFANGATGTFVLQGVSGP